MRSKRGFWRVFLSFVYLLYKLAISLFEKLAARYFFIALLPYAFGNLNEEIKMGILASASVNKPIIYLLPPEVYSQKYLILNNAIQVFTKHVENYPIIQRAR